jgi:hypothetical protein
MTGTLALYSAVFARYALAVSPKNYLLFGCHVVNFSAQLTQGYRYLNYWKYVDITRDSTNGDGANTYGSFGGREASIEQKAKEGASTVKDTASKGVETVKGAAKDVKAKISSS